MAALQVTWDNGCLCLMVLSLYHPSLAKQTNVFFSILTRDGSLSPQCLAQTPQDQTFGKVTVLSNFYKLFFTIFWLVLGVPLVIWNVALQSPSCFLEMSFNLHQTNFRKWISIGGDYGPIYLVQSWALVCSCSITKWHLPVWQQIL